MSTDYTYSSFILLLSTLYKGICTVAKCQSMLLLLSPTSAMPSLPVINPCAFDLNCSVVLRMVQNVRGYAIVLVIAYTHAIWWCSSWSILINSAYASWIAWPALGPNIRIGLDQTPCRGREGHVGRRCSRPVINGVWSLKSSGHSSMIKLSFVTILMFISDAMKSSLEAAMLRKTRTLSTWKVENRKKKKRDVIEIIHPRTIGPRTHYED